MKLWSVASLDSLSAFIACSEFVKSFPVGTGMYWYLDMVLPSRNLWLSTTEKKDTCNHQKCRNRKVPGRERFAMDGVGFIDSGMLQVESGSERGGYSIKQPSKSVRKTFNASGIENTLWDHSVIFDGPVTSHEIMKHEYRNIFILDRYVPFLFIHPSCHQLPWAFMFASCLLAVAFQPWCVLD